MLSTDMLTIDNLNDVMLNIDMLSVLAFFSHAEQKRNELIVVKANCLKRVLINSKRLKVLFQTIALIVFKQMGKISQGPVL
jgi:hypothetical protein